MKNRQYNNKIVLKQQQNTGTVNQQQNTVKKSTSLKQQDIVKTRYYGIINFRGGPMFMAFVVNPYIPTNLKHNHFLNVY